MVSMINFDVILFLLQIPQIATNLTDSFEDVFIMKPRRSQSYNDHTANIFTAKIEGFHCGTNPTALSLRFLQSSTACSGPL